jgi:basic membrane protein A and related proteins
MPRAKPSNVLTTLVFTDIVASSQVAEEIGDRRWRELLARHHRIVREGLREYGGRELDTAGDGVFARFDSPASAISFAAWTADALRELGIEIRAGIHIGECEVFEGKLSGVNVHAAARTMGQAGPGEILVTGSVRDLVRGAGFGFSDRGVHELRGIDGEWHLFEVTSIDDSHRSPPLPEGEARARRGLIEPPPLVQRRRIRLSAVAVAIALVLAGAAFALAHAVGGASAAPLTGCEVTSTPSLTDGGFNQAVYDGLTDAATKWGIGVRDAVTSSGSVREWTRHMSNFIRQRCGLIVTFGSFIGPPMVAAAKANPQQRFAIADAADVHGTPNLLSIEFRPDQAAFLAGYLAAGLTKTHKVGMFGGIPLPTVTPFMDGFAAGVLYYNRVHGTKVRVVGWNPKTHGMFVNTDPTDFSAFTDPRAAAELTNLLIRSDGADVIFPVDGPAGEAGACSVAQRARGVLLIGVDTDQHYSTPDCEAQWVTSVMKVYRRMVYLAMGQIVHHQFKGGSLEGTLENGGVGLARFYGFETRIAPSLRRELDSVKKGIENHSITVDPQSYLTG